MLAAPAIAIPLTALAWLCLAATSGSGERAVPPLPLHHPHDVIDDIDLNPDFPSDPTVFVCSAGTMPLFLRSPNRAFTWENAGRGIRGRTARELEIAADWPTSRTAFAAVRPGGLHRTTDGGESWQLVFKHDDLQTMCLGAIADGGRRRVYVGSPRQLWQSDDGGETLRSIAVAGPATGSRYDTIAVHHGEGEAGALRGDRGPAGVAPRRRRSVGGGRDSGCAQAIRAVAELRCRPHGVGGDARGGRARFDRRRRQLREQLGGPRGSRRQLRDHRAELPGLQGPVRGDARRRSLPLARRRCDLVAHRPADREDQPDRQSLPAPGDLTGLARGPVAVLRHLRRVVLLVRRRRALDGEQHQPDTDRQEAGAVAEVRRGRHDLRRDLRQPLHGLHRSRRQLGAALGPFSRLQRLQHRRGAQLPGRAGSGRGSHTRPGAHRRWRAHLGAPGHRAGASEEAQPARDARHRLLARLCRGPDRVRGESQRFLRLGRCRCDLEGTRGADRVGLSRRAGAGLARGPGDLSRRDVVAPLCRFRRELERAARPGQGARDPVCAGLCPHR